MTTACVKRRKAAGVGDRFGEVMDLAKTDPALVGARFDEIIQPALLSRSALDWEAIFAEADVPAAALRGFEDQFDDPQIVHNQTYRTVADDSLGADYLQVRYPAFVDGERIETAGLAAPAMPQTETDAD